MRRSGNLLSLFVVALISALLSSTITVYLGTQSGLFTGKGENEKSSKIIVDQNSKSQNVYQAVAEKATPSVVGVTATGVNRDDFFDIAYESKNIGTGIIVDSAGYILTNSHVVEDGQYKDVDILFNDGSTAKGKVIWHDPALDLAIIKSQKANLVPAELGDSDKVQVGDIAIAIGNPLGLELQKTVTQGIISGLNRTITTASGKMTGLLQTDASINSGNSGGPLLNQYGQIIGINTAKNVRAEGVGFAIPINTAKKIVRTVIKDGSYNKVLLGVRAIDVKFYEASIGKSLGTDSGIYVKEVIKGSSSERAGIKPGDIIIKMGNTSVETMSDLEKDLYNYNKGSKTQVVVNRNGKNVKLDVTFD